MFSSKRKMQVWMSVLNLFLLLSGCGTAGNSGSGGATAIVTVTDYSGLRVPDATVVMGDSNGAMKAYGVTDSNGQIMFTDAPADATITAATTCLRSGSTTTNYSINIELDVNGSVVLPIDNCETSVFTIPMGSDTPLGTVTVNVSNIPSDVSKNQITVGRQIFLSQGSLITKQTITVREIDLDSNGTVSIIVMGKDSGNNPIAYGVLLDQAFSPGMTANISMEPMSFIQYEITNIPATAVRLRPVLGVYSAAHQRNFGSVYSYPLSSAPSSTTISTAYIPGFGESVSHRLEIELDQDHNGSSDSYQSLSLGSSVGSPTNQIFDLTKALSAPYVSVANADTATPTLSWSGIDPASTSIYVDASVSTMSSQFYLSFNSLSRSRTSIKFPELPDSLAAFRPGKVDYFSVSTSAFEGSVSMWSSGNYSAGF